MRRYVPEMRGTTAVVVGDQGSVVVPADVRARRSWTAGTELLFVETDEGMLLTERATALRRIRALVGGAALADELLAERRLEAQAEDEDTRRSSTRPR